MDGRAPLWAHQESQAQTTEADPDISSPGTPLPPWAGMAGPIASRSTAPASGRRFAALSTLPEGLRLPPKRDALPARHQREAAPVPLEESLEPNLPPAVSARPIPRTPRQGPPADIRTLVAPAAPAPAAPPPTTDTALLPPPSERQLGFNCPACFSVLIIRDPASYDGRPAPCPTCGSRIVPPRIIPDSPFRVVERAALPSVSNGHRHS